MKRLPHGHFRARNHTDPRCRLTARKLGSRDRRVQCERAIAKGFEDHVCRHDLGERGGVPLVVLVLCIEDATVNGVKKKSRSGVRARAGFTGLAMAEGMGRLDYSVIATLWDRWSAGD